VHVIIEQRSQISSRYLYQLGMILIEMYIKHDSLVEASKVYEQMQSILADITNVEMQKKYEQL